MLRLFEVGQLRSRSLINVFSTGVVSLILYRRFVVLIQSLVTYQYCSAVALNCSAYLLFGVYRYCGRFGDSIVVVVNIAIEFVRSMV